MDQQRPHHFWRIESTDDWLIDWSIDRLIDMLMTNSYKSSQSQYLSEMCHLLLCCYEWWVWFVVNEVVSRWTNMSIGQINQFTKPYQPFMDSANWQDFVFISYDILSDHARGSLHDINIIMQRWTRTMSHNSSATIRSMMFISLCHLKVDTFVAPWSWRSSYHHAGEFVLWCRTYPTQTSLHFAAR